MVNPVTVNTALIVPLTGADVNLWGEDDINPNMIAIDGMFAGVQSISVSNVPITLTSPAGFVPTPSGGPTQSQNRVLRFTGVMTGNVTVTLPLPGSYIIENLTTGNFVLSFRGVTATEVIGTPQGERLEIYNDGANVRFVNLARVGALEMWEGISSIPAWVTACTVKPYLLNDGSIYNIADFPWLGARFLSTFGGNGLTTFGVPDHRGRVPLAYDGTGTRITVAGCGLNGQTLGASIDSQQATITSSNQLPSIASGAANAISVTPPVGYNVPATPASGGIGGQSVPSGVASNVPYAIGSSNSWTNTGPFVNNSQTINVVFTNASPSGHPNVQPGQVTGIYVTKT